MLEYRAFDQRWVVDHQRECLALIQIIAIRVRNLSPREALLVKQRFPADAVSPTLQHLNIEAIVPDIVERMFNSPILKKLSRFPACIAALDSINR